MLRGLIGVGVLMMLSAAYPPQPREEDSEDPLPLDKICGSGRLECADAEDITPEGADYGLRKLSSGNWVGTALDDITDIKTTTKTSFWRLFSFIRGNNAEEIKIDMTVPVVYAWEVDQTSGSLISGTMFFYLPQEHQDSPPKPRDSRVFVKTFPEMDLYYRAFGGNDRSDEKYRTEFIALKTAVEDAGHSLDFHYTFTAGFTRPFWGPQRQEVMYADESTPFN